ncbi:MAG: NAD(P)H-dependent oxidoreductase [Candidatus Margulisiibacteriota bacterium]
MYIPVILGTAREGRQSEKVANFVFDLVKKSGLETELVDVREYRVPATDREEEIPQAKRWMEKLLRSDGLIIVSPEYNHTYPGELKMFLDMLYTQYLKRPVGLVGVSEGPWGGTRGIQALRLTCLALGMHPILEAVYFPMVQDKFDETGKIKDVSYEKKVNGMVKSLTAQSEALRSLFPRTA